MFDERGFPIVFLSCPAEFTAEWVAELDRSFTKLLARRSKFVIVCDLRGVKKPADALGRKRLGEFLNRSDVKHAQVVVGAANLVQSAAVRAAMTAILWIWTPPHPIYAPVDLADAIRWTLKRLREEGVHVPEASLSYAMEMERGGMRAAAR